MIEIIPAIMPAWKRDIAEKAMRFGGLVSMMQVDIMDGRFVPEATWPYRIAGAGEGGEREEGAVALPLVEGMHFEVDLMIEAPEQHIAHWSGSGAKRYIFHIESIRDSQALLRHAKLLRAEHGAEIGFALNIETDISELVPYMGEADFVQCMGIARIGYQGEPFDARAIQKISDLREQYSDIIISVDGGVSLRTAPELVKAGARRLVAGSALLNIKTEDIPSALAKFQEL